MTLFLDCGAIFSPDRKHRYLLWRTWDAATPPINFLMLNPSTADENKNDPTVERCERRARSMGAGGLLVTNLFAIRSTDPHLMKLATDPVGPDNDQHIIEAAKRASVVIAGWGDHGKHLGRSTTVRALLASEGIIPAVLRLTKAGNPGHPLYVPYDIKPTIWVEP